MSGRVFWPAVVVGVAAVMLSLSALPLLVLNGDELLGSDTTGSVILAVSFAAVGSVIVARRPTNVIGWILLGSGFFGSLNAVAADYAQYVLVTRPGSLPGGPLMGWLGSFVWAISAMAFPLIVWLFPTGRPPSRRWRWLIVPIVAGAGLVVVPMALATWDVRESAILAGTLPEEVAGELPATLTLVGTALIGASLLLALVSAVVRFRRSGVDERQQLKWLGYAAALTLVVMVTASPAAPVEMEGPVGELLSILAVVALPSIPVAIGVAILRYRLYDIDRIISRTVTYALVVGLLAAVYAGGVFLLADLLPFEGDVAVAASTLAVAALFGPLRRRVQSGVDRRFNRARYDAERVVSGFAERLRSEVDLESVRDDLAMVVDHTVQPTSAAVWLRETVP